MSRKPVITVVTASEDDWPPGLEDLQGQAELLPGNTRETLCANLPRADILLVTDFRTDLLQDCWPEQHAIQWIHATSAGVDALMIDPIRNSDIPVTNARGIFDRPIAEFVLGLVLCFAKDFHQSVRYQDQRTWKHRDTESIQGARALVVGTGSIGRQIGRLLGNAGLELAGVARTPRDDDPDFGRIHAADAMLDLLPDFDYVVVAAPLTDSTRGLFDTRAFSRMKPTARFINIGRGPIVRTDDLVEALRAGKLAGAGLDVFEQEPLPRDHPLWGMPNVIMSAHMAGDVKGWRNALSRQFLDNFQRWRQQQALHNLVDKARGYAAS